MKPKLPIIGNDGDAYETSDWDGIDGFDIRSPQYPYEEHDYDEDDYESPNRNTYDEEDYWGFSIV